MKYYFDCETGPLDADELAKVMPEFKPKGNLKDPAKIEADIAEKRQDWLAGAALRATTGRILAITSAWDDAEPAFYCCPDERTMLDIVLTDLNQAITMNASVYTWNGHGFDLPFICQRAAVHGLPAFRQLTTSFKGRWTWAEQFIDAMQVFAGPFNSSSGCSLATVAAALGVGQKSGSGADFAGLLVSDPVKAKEYGLNDVRLLRGIVQRMGI